MEEHGIYYIHNEENILEGHALIIGPENTPYAYGYYLFRFIFPATYPYDPPRLVYLTNDGITRFNPNLYRNGKVCISLLNTWPGNQGEQWSSTQNISSILLSLCTVLNDTPLLNEPNIHRSHRDYNAYNNIVTYKNYEVALYGILNKKYLAKDCEIFYDVIKETFLKNYIAIYNNLEELEKKCPNQKSLQISIYPQTVRINYTQLIQNIKKLHGKLK